MIPGDRITSLTRALRRETLAQIRAEACLGAGSLFFLASNTAFDSITLKTNTN